MKKIIKIPLINKPGEPNVNNGYVYSKEDLNKAINSKIIKNMINIRKLYLYEERTGEYFISHHKLPNENIVAPIVKIREDSIDIEVDNEFNNNRLKDCKAGIIFIANKKRANKSFVDIRIMGYELINIPAFNKSKEEMKKNGK